jgi:hypothetical protein
MKSWQAILLFLLTAASGCTTAALQRRTLNQATSVSDLRYKEVLDNLAYLAANHWALPSYSTIYSGTSKISDQVQGVSASVIARELIKPFGTLTALDQEVFDLQLQRGVTQNWSLDPISAPEKLRAFRYANWWILSGPSSIGPDGFAMLGQYQPRSPPGHYFNVLDALAAIPPGWLQLGTRWDIPSNACYQASADGTCVWVTPDAVAGLTAFTLVLQKIALVPVDSTYFPKPNTRKIQLEVSVPAVRHLPNGATQQATADIKMTLNVDESGAIVGGPGQYASVVKRRMDNIGTDPQLRSQVAAAASH